MIQQDSGRTLSTRLLMAVVIASLLPMLPLFMFKYPIAELV
jgi:hypothetical protein